MKFNNKDIALFGGSFDPPHLAHEEIINTFSNIFKEVWVLPQIECDYKGLTPLKNRMEMLSLLDLKENVSLVDLNNIRDNFESGYIRTWELIKYLEKKYPKRSFKVVIGADQEMNLENWHHCEKLKPYLEVVERKGYHHSNHHYKMKLSGISSTECRKTFLGLNENVKKYILENNMYRKR